MHRERGLAHPGHPRHRRDRHRPARPICPVLAAARPGLAQQLVQLLQLRLPASEERRSGRQLPRHHPRCHPRPRSLRRHRAARHRRRGRGGQRRVIGQHLCLQPGQLRPRVQAQLIGHYPPRRAIHRRRRGLGRTRTGRRRKVKGGVGFENPLLQVLQRASRIDAELISQVAAQPVVLAERIGPPSGSVQRDHEHPAHRFPCRVLRRQLTQFVDDPGCFAKPEPEPEQALCGGQPPLLEDHGDGLDDPAADVGHDRSGPERERLPQRRHRRRRVCMLSPGDRSVELAEVELVLGEHYPVARALRHDQARSSGQAMPEVGDDLTDLAGGRRWRLLVPARLDQPAHGDDAAHGQQEHAEDAVVTGPGQRYPLVTRPHFERAQEPESHLHRTALPTALIRGQAETLRSSLPACQRQLYWPGSSDHTELRILRTGNGTVPQRAPDGIAFGHPGIVSTDQTARKAL